MKNELFEYVMSLSRKEIDDLLYQRKLVSGDFRNSHTLGGDYSVHLKACKWDAQGLLGNYFHNLERVLTYGKDVPDENPSLYSMMYYKPGMYSIAALLTLLHFEGNEK